MEEEDDRAVFDRRGRRARRREASSDGDIIKCDASNGFVVEELLAEIYESLRVGKGSGRSPPCVTRWSGGAVSHHRRIAAAAGAAKQLIMLLNLEVNITAGSLTSCPGRCFLALAVTSSCARRTAGGDVLSTRSTGIFVVMVVLVQLCCARRLGDGIYCCTTARWFGAARRLAAGALMQHCCHEPQRLL